jgi:hypothetical protein
LTNGAARTYRLTSSCIIPRHPCTTCSAVMPISEGCSSVPPVRYTAPARPSRQHQDLLVQRRLLRYPQQQQCVLGVQCAQPAKPDLQIRSALLRNSQLRNGTGLVRARNGRARCRLRRNTPLGIELREAPLPVTEMWESR